MDSNGQVLSLSLVFAQSHTANSNSKTQGRQIVDILQQLTISQMMISVTYTSSWSELLNVPTLHTFHQGLITIFAYLKETHWICLNNHHRLRFQQGNALIYYELLASCHITCAGQGGFCCSQMSWILKYTRSTSKASQMDCSQLLPKTWVASVNLCFSPCGVYSISSSLTLHLTKPCDF